MSRPPDDASPSRAAAAARRHDRHPRRRPARPHVGAGRGAARLSLPRLRAGRGQPRHAGRAPPPPSPPTRTPRRCAASPPRSTSSPSSSRTCPPRRCDALRRSARAGPGVGGAADLPGPAARRRISSSAPACRSRPGARCESQPSWPTRSPRIGLPAVLKTTRLGYDGRGQAVLRQPGRRRRGVRRAGAEAADPGGLRRPSTAEVSAHRRARRGRRARRVRRGGEPPPRPHPGHDRSPRRACRSAWPRRRAAIAARIAEALGLVGRDGARDVPAAGRRPARQRDRPAPAQLRATGPSTPASPASSSSTSAPSPACRSPTRPATTTR